MSDEPGAGTLSTAPEGDTLRVARRGRWFRRLFSVVLVAFLAAALAGVFGIRSGEVEAAGGGYELTVSYAEVTRPGLTTPWTIEVRHPGGFPTGLVTVATTSEYADAFEQLQPDPEPVESISDGSRTIWSFQPPAGGDTVAVSLSGRIDPSLQLVTKRAVTSVLVDGAPVVSVRYRTYVTP